MMPTRNPRRVATPVDHVLRALTSPQFQAQVGLTDTVVQTLEATAPKARATAAMDRVNSQTLTVLESTWAAIRRRHKELPAVAFTIGGSETTRGHFHAETWADSMESGYTRHEVFLAGERLKDGPREVLATLLHEAAHALAYVRKITDTSRGGRYHNAAFKALALELGLEAAQDKAIGWSVTSLPDTTADAYRVALDRLATIGVHRRQLTRGEATGRKNNNNGQSLACPTCGRKVRASMASVEAGPIVCWPCYQDTEDLESATMVGEDLA
jgi:hypothetical protein